MFIKVYTKSQLVLLRNLNPILKKKYRLPYEVIDRADRILRNNKFGKSGFIAILLEPLWDDTREMEDIINCYPRKLKIMGDIVDLPIEEQDSWMTKDREWYFDTWKIKGESSYIYIIYSMTLERLYGKR